MRDLGFDFLAEELVTLGAAECSKCERNRGSGRHTDADDDNVTMILPDECNLNSNSGLCTLVDQLKIETERLPL